MGTLYQVDGATGQARIIIQNGTSNPVSGTLGELHYRSDQDQLQIYDGTLFKAVLGGSYRVYREKVNETPNGAITAFTVDNPYVNTTTEVYLNGVLQEITTDYTETNPATGTITFTVAPLTGAIITVSYSRLEGSSLPLFNKFSVTVGTPVDTYSGSTTVFDLPFAYTPGAGNLLVFSSGVLMLPGATEDYQETDLNTITFNTARTAGEIVQLIKVGAANDEGTSGWADSGTVVALRTATDQVQVGDGTAAIPALSFISDPNTGIYRVGADHLAISTNGTLRWQVTSTGDLAALGGATTQILASSAGATAPAYSFNVGGATGSGMYTLGTGWLNFATNGTQVGRFNVNAFEVLDGSASLPSISFISDPDTGLYNVNPNEMSTTVAGTEITRFKAAGLEMRAGVIENRDGSAALPSYSFANDTNSGIFRQGSDDVRMSAGGVGVVKWTAAGQESFLQHFFADGTIALPSITFGGDPDTGIYRNAANELSFVTGGTRYLRISNEILAEATIRFDSGPSTARIWANDGTVSNPSYSFHNDVDTGMYRIGVNNLGFAANGVEYLRVGVTGASGAIHSSAVGGFSNTISSAGNTAIYYAEHTDNTNGNSNAALVLRTGGTAGGDPFIQFDITSGSPATWKIGVDNSDSDTFKIQPQSTLSGGAGFIMSGAGNIIMQNGTSGSPAFSFYNAQTTGIYHVGSGYLGYSVPAGANHHWYVGGTEVLRYDGNAASFTSDGLPTKTVDLGHSLRAFDDVYADDFQNVADIPFFDYVQDEQGNLVEINDLEIIKNIQPKRDENGNLLFNENGHAYWNDDTLPQWIFTNKEGNRGELVKDAEGKPWVSMKVLAGLSLGAVGQLIKKVEALEAKIAQLEGRE